MNDRDNNQTTCSAIHFRAQIFQHQIHHQIRNFYDPIDECRKYKLSQPNSFEVAVNITVTKISKLRSELRQLNMAVERLTSNLAAIASYDRERLKNLLNINGNQIDDDRRAAEPPGESFNYAHLIDIK